MKKILYFAAISLLFSCSKSEIKKLNPIEARNKVINILLTNQVDISPTIFPEQLKIKTLVASAKHLGVFGKFSYQYDDKNRLTNIVSTATSNAGSSFLEVKYDDTNKIITENGAMYNTDALGRVLSLSNGSNFQIFVYKNGFPIQKSGSFTNTFDSKGNVVESIREEQYKFTFEYTDFPNNIRQEIKSTSNIQVNFRDEYSGKFSTNLLKKCGYSRVDGFSPEELNFSYEFDDKGRVSKMTVDRPLGGTNLIYTYEYTYF